MGAHAAVASPRKPRMNKPHIDSRCRTEFLRQHYQARANGDTEAADTLACKYLDVTLRVGPVSR